MPKHYSQSDDLEEVFVGRKIVKVEMDVTPETVTHVRSYNGEKYIAPAVQDGTSPIGRLTLDDGTLVYVNGHEGGCGCSAGCFYLKHLETTNNIITAVKTEQLDAEGQELDKYAWDEPASSWYLYVIADNQQINVARFDGGDGNGYYGTGFHLTVLAAEKP